MIVLAPQAHASSEHRLHIDTKNSQAICYYSLQCVTLSKVPYPVISHGECVDAGKDSLLLCMVSSRCAVGPSSVTHFVIPHSFGGIQPVEQIQGIHRIYPISSGIRHYDDVTGRSTHAFARSLYGYPPAASSTAKAPLIPSRMFTADFGRVVFRTSGASARYDVCWQAP